MGIIGPNGSGKTTLLQAINRVLRPHGGEILVDGKNIWKIPLKKLSQMVAVSSQIIEPVLATVEEYVLLGRFPYYRKYQFFKTRNMVLHDLNLASEYCNRLVLLNNGSSYKIR